MAMVYGRQFEYSICYLVKLYEVRAVLLDQMSDSYAFVLAAGDNSDK